MANSLPHILECYHDSGGIYVDVRRVVLFILHVWTVLMYLPCYSLLELLGEALELGILLGLMIFMGGLGFAYISQSDPEIDKVLRNRK